MGREDRRDGQRDGATGRPHDERRFTDRDYRDGYARGRSAEVNRELTGHAGQRNPSSSK